MDPFMKKLLFALSTVFLTFSAALPVQAEEITIQLPELYDYSYRITKGGLSIVDGSGTLAPTGSTISGDVPQLTWGSMEAASIWIS